MENNPRKVTPTMKSKGFFDVRSPFTLNRKKVYEVVAIREFPDLWAEHVNVFEKYYEPEGLTEEDYNRDIGLGASIVSLKSEEGILFVPDTYIVSYPDLGVADYHHVVLGVSLGPIDRNKNLKGVMDDIKELVSTFLGVKPEVTLHIAPMKEAITNKEAKQLEQVRKGHINVPKTAELKYRDEKRKVAVF